MFCILHRIVLKYFLMLVHVIKLLNQYLDNVHFFIKIISNFELFESIISFLDFFQRALIMVSFIYNKSLLFDFFLIIIKSNLYFLLILVQSEIIVIKWIKVSVFLNLIILLIIFRKFQVQKFIDHFLTWMDKFFQAILVTIHCLF